jgi:hypothetical protein
MPSESEIIKEIETFAKNYSNWTIGITADIERQRQEHNNPQYWHSWNAITKISAKNIEKYFLDKGMKSDTCSDFSPIDVYIF